MDLRTFEKYYYAVIMIITMFLAAMVGAQMNWMSNEDPLSEGDNCIVATGENGVCKNARICEPYITRRMKYNIKNRCGFVGFDEIICCPKPVANNPGFHSFRLKPISGHDNPTATKPSWSLKHKQDNLSIGDKCKLVTGEDGICKTTMDCGPLRMNVIDYNERNRCTYTPFHEVTCCPTSPATGEKFGIPDWSPSKEACRHYKTFNAAESVSKISGGTAVNEGDFPHIGALISKSENNNDITYFCGTSLISEKYTLTAAHCVNTKSVSEVQIRFGVINLRSQDDKYIPVDVDIEEFIIHDEYRYPIKSNDIAILKLAQNVTFSSLIFPACLHTDIEDLPSSQKLFIAGWGLTEMNTPSDILLMTTVETFPLKTCSEQYKTKRGRNVLGSGHYCTYDSNSSTIKDSSHGDSGGPLQLDIKVPTTLLGVLSFGHNPETKKPSVCTRVAHYLKWIEDIVWPVVKDST